MLAGSLLLCGTFAGCVREEPVVPGSGDDGIFSLAEDEYGLGVTLSLNQLSGSPSRAALGDLGANGLKDIEEYVNTDNLYILFFNLDGTFLFQINKPVAIPIGQSALGNDNQWFIRIPVKEINENLIRYIEENPFKIAVLANWTFDADINTGGTWDAFEFHEPLDDDGNLIYDDHGKLQGDHISLLAHAQRDNVYENATLHGYDHLTYRTATGPHMGPYTEWVRNYHKSIQEADQDIRYNYDVKENTYTNPRSKYVDDHGNVTAINHFEMPYNNIWQVWNFGGKFLYEAGETQKAAWLELNRKAREGFVSQLGGEISAGTMLKWSLENYSDLEITADGTVPDSGMENPSDLENMTGIVLTAPNLSSADNDDGNPLNLGPSPDGTPHPYIHFTAHADGYVRVIYEAAPGARLFVHVGRNNTPQNNASGYQKDNKSSRFDLNGEGYFSNGKIADIPFDPKDVYVYMVVDPESVPADPSVAGPSVTIYGIEYIESRHLYDVDRGAVLPSKDYPIPMYGVQDFDPIGEYWEPGVLFNLSQFNNAQKTGYNYRNVSLLRSLSRVEVKLLKSAFPKKPSHVYMRSMNRSARITPVDFFTPTDIIWNGFNASSIDDVRRLQNYVEVGNLNEQNIIQTTPGVVQEEQNIMQYGPIYIGTGNNAGQTRDQMLDEYRKTTAWPFGIWEPQWGWDWNRGTEFVNDFDTYKVGQTRAHTHQVVPQYPRILHTRISRSDYSRFTEVEDPDYWHYIMYIPEKNITDADEPGNIADRPKIIHVELRFNGGFPVYDGNGNPSTDDPDNEVDNFDDKAAYRLYFTEGGRARLGDFEFTGRDSWDAYEYDWNIASQHWPIIRNHVYIFTVNGGIDNSADVTLQVLGPDKRGTGWYFD